MSFAKTYDPNTFEPTTYALWETSGGFSPQGEGEPYCVVMPPPNANGNLHIGHALTTALQDILVRFHRMKGRAVAYLPGADHAGFETWVVYEKELQKQGKSRFDFSREQLYSQVWDYVDKNRGHMELQLRALGASASWQDMTFTLDKKVINTVYSTFKHLWDDGLVYRGERIVNYCPVHQTGFSDIEVVHKNEKGKLWKIAYPMLDHIGEIIIATTRPETMLGDTAIAVHPDDERYKSLIGSRVQVPLTKKEIPIIADEYVDMNYGTGAVKITPAHDPNDFDIAARHDLASHQILDASGHMINVPPQFVGMTSLAARERVLSLLKVEELLRGESTVEHAVAHCYKCHTVLEPMLKDQWFLRVKPLAEAAIEAIKVKKIEFVPTSRGRTLIQYLENLHDWNLSRQIPWGIPIPAFQNTDDPSDWIFDSRVDEETITVDGKTYRREEDTFDTWFSSGQWPYVTTDYLAGGPLAKFYPTSVLETGGDILYPWVSKMIMLGLYATDKVPFTTVYLHGLVLDEHSQKMSKSKGNVINPMDIISQYGSDALRLGIIANRSAGLDQGFSTSSVIAGRNFCNKLWNMARFVQDKLGDNFTPGRPETVTLADDWIVSQLTEAATTIERYLTEYRFSEASELLYHTVWGDVADWYIEASKQDADHQMLNWVLETCLKLAHPFAPFVTETIWQTLPWRDSLLMTTEWPTMLDHDPIAAGQFGRIKKLVTEFRYVVSELPGNKRYNLLYQTDSLIEENSQLIKSLSRALEVRPVDQPRGLRLAASGREAWLDVDSETLYEHQSNLEVRLAQTRQVAKKLEARLANVSYRQKAPAHLIEETEQQLTQKQRLIDQLVEELNVLD